MYEKNFGKELEDREIIEKAFEKSRTLIYEYALKEEDFIDSHGEENVAKDTAYVESMERKFEQTSSEEQKYCKMLGDVFETMIYDQMDNEWLGPDAVAIKTARYDDIKNGVDQVVEFQEGKGTASHLALAIDATTSDDLGKKVERIKKEIEKGEMAHIKYFLSEYMREHTGFGRGEMVNIPRVIIGADRNIIKELSELWLENKNKELAKHPIQFQILEEIMIQCEVFKNYAAKIQDDKDRSKIVNMYDKTRETVKNIYEEKKKTIQDDGFRQDEVFDAIKRYMKYF